MFGPKEQRLYRHVPLDKAGVDEDTAEGGACFQHEEAPLDANDRREGNGERPELEAGGLHAFQRCVAMCSGEEDVCMGTDTEDGEK